MFCEEAAVADWDLTEEGGALGFVETFGLTTAIEAADAMGKAARVRVRTVLNADAGLICVVCEGDLGACQAAVDAGTAAAARLGHFLTSNIIARPFGDTYELTARRARRLYTPPPPAKPDAAKPAPTAQPAAAAGQPAPSAKVKKPAKPGRHGKK